MALVVNEDQKPLILTGGHTLAPGDDPYNVDPAAPNEAALITEGSLRVIDGSVAPPVPASVGVAVRALRAYSLTPEQFVIDTTDAQTGDVVGMDGLPKTRVSEEDLPAAIADQLADNPDVVAAAAALAQSDATLVHKTDGGIPSIKAYDGYDELVPSATNQIGRGITTTGRNHLPLIVSQQLEMAPRVGTDGLPIGTVVTKTIETVAGYSKVSRQALKMAENALDSTGRVPNWLLRRWWQRAGSLGLGAGSGPIYLLPVAGQSNAGKQDPVVNAVINTYDDRRVLRYDPDLGMVVVESGIEWLGSGFARQWIRDNPTKRICIVPCGRGASGFFTTSLDPAPSGYERISATVGTWDRNFFANTGQTDPLNYPALYLDQRVAAASAACAEMNGGVAPPKIALIWCQGEADNGTDPAVYEARQDDLLEWARTTLWGVPTLPILVASMTPNRIAQTGFTDIDRVHMDTPRRLLWSAYSRGPENQEENTGDGFRTHFLPWAHEERGAVVATRGLRRARQNGPGVLVDVAENSLHPPHRIEVTRSGSALKARWEHPACRFTSTLVDLSTDAGATWTPITLDHVMAISATATAAGAASLRFAVSNGTHTSYYAKVDV